MGKRRQPGKSSRKEERLKVEKKREFHPREEIEKNESRRDN
jgi:hypothetical protein